MALLKRWHVRDVSPMLVPKTPCVYASDAEGGNDDAAGEVSIAADVVRVRCRLRSEQGFLAGNVLDGELAPGVCRRGCQHRFLSVRVYVPAESFKRLAYPSLLFLLLLVQPSSSRRPALSLSQNRSKPIPSSPLFLPCYSSPHPSHEVRTGGRSSVVLNGLTFPVEGIVGSARDIRLESPLGQLAEDWRGSAGSACGEHFGGEWNCCCSCQCRGGRCLLARLLALSG